MPAPACRRNADRKRGTSHILDTPQGARDIGRSVFGALYWPTFQDLGATLACRPGSPESGGAQIPSDEDEKAPFRDLGASHFTGTAAIPEVGAQILEEPRLPDIERPLP